MRARRARELGSERAGLVLAAVTDPILVIDGEGLLAYANEAAADLFGYTVEDWLGRCVLDVVEPADADLAAESLTSTGQTAGRALPVELRVLTAAGESRWVEVVANNCLGVTGLQGIVLSIRDITVRRELEAARREADARFEAAFDHAPIGMALLTVDGHFARVNARLSAILGRDEDELLGMMCSQILVPRPPDEQRLDWGEVVNGSANGSTIERRFLRGDSTVGWVEIALSAVKDAADAPLYVVAQVQEITGRKRAEQLLREASLRDPLTGLGNRRALDERMTAMFGDQPYATLTVLSCDLDNLKAVNDTFGHSVGDALLSSVGRRLAAMVRDDDFVARVGGDEFIVLTASTAIAPYDLRTRIIERVEAPVTVGGITVMPHISVGFATRTPADASASEVLNRADSAMYANKRSRRSALAPD